MYDIEVKFIYPHHGTILWSYAEEYEEKVK